MRLRRNRAIHSLNGSNRGAGIVLADGLHSCVAALRVQAAHDPVDVILDRKFRDAHGLGDFLIRKATGEERNELLLSAG